MKRHTEAHSFEVGELSGPRNCRYLGPHFVRSRERVVAYDPRDAVTAGNWKDRSKTVAHELQHLAASPSNRRNLAVEVAIEQVNQSLRRKPVSKRSETAHVREPDRRMNCLCVAAPNLPGEDPLSGIMPDIRIQ